MSFENKSLNVMDRKPKLLGAYIRLKREEENMSMSFMADVLKMSKAYLSEIEHGKKYPADYTLKQILKVLETQYISDDYILDDLHNYLMNIHENITLLRIDEAKSIINEVMAHQELYLHSEGFILFDLIQLFDLVQFYTNSDQCDYLINIIQKHIMFLSREETAIFHDIVASLYIYRGALECAKYHLEEGIEQVPLTSNAYGMILYHLARLNQIHGNLIRSLDYCEKAKTEFYNKLNYKRILYVEIFEANIYSMFFYFEEAEKKYLQILEKAKTSHYLDVQITVLDNLSWMKLRDGQFDECLKYSELAIQLGTTYSEALLYAPICYYKKNEINKCLKSIDHVKDQVTYPLKYLLNSIYFLCKNDGIKFIENLENFLLKDSGMDKEMKCFVNELMAEYYIKNGDFKEASRIQQTIIQTIKCM